MLSVCFVAGKGGLPDCHFVIFGYGKHFALFILNALKICIT